MSNTYFQFKQFIIHQEKCSMKVTTDASLFGAWVASLKINAVHVLDIGAGTGLLSLMVAQKNDAFIEAVEIDSSCHEQLNENISQSPWEKRCNAVHQDIREYESDKRFDLILSNPPFFEGQLTSPTQGVNLARHEEGLSFTSLFSQSKRLMHKDGYFFVLIPSNRKDETIQLAKQVDLFPHYSVAVKQSPMHDPFRYMIGFSVGTTDSKEEVIVIKNAQNEYSTRFIELLKDYYLFL
jgi:tRNA1Val (adenine37-N6)-methyltransferase